MTKNPLLLAILLTLLTACMSSPEGAPAPQVTVTPEATVTSTPPPTETPLPTLTPTPVAVDGIAEDAEGNQLAYLNGEWLVVPTLDADYAKLMVDGEKVVAVDADGDVAYEYDMAAGSWMEFASVPKEVDIAQHFDIVSTDPVENFVLAGGAVVNGEVLVDRSMKRLGVGGVTMPDSLGAELLTRIAMTYLNSHGVNGAQVTLGEYQQMLAQVQAQQRDPNDLLVEAHLFDLANSDAGYQPTQVVFWPGEGAVLPEGVRAVNQVSLMYVRGHEELGDDGYPVVRTDVPGFKITDRGFGCGFGAVLNGDTLYLLIGPSFLTNSNPTNKQLSVAGYPLVAMDWIEAFEGNSISNLYMSDKYEKEAKKLISRGIEVDN